MAVISSTSLRTARLRMVEQLLERRGIRDRRVLDAMRCVERHLFVDAALQARAYGPYALPIGCGQKLPHPHTVASMAEALRLQGGERVLEIGTGSGYQTAILAQLAREVCSLERWPELAEAAERRLRALGFRNARVHVRADLRWPEAAPYEAIHVGAAAPEVPGMLLAQLGTGGRLVLPIGRGSLQRLQVLVRHGDCVTTTGLGGCRLQPLLDGEPVARAEPKPRAEPMQCAEPLAAQRRLQPGQGPHQRV